MLGMRCSKWGRAKGVGKRRQRGMQEDGAQGGKKTDLREAVG